MKITADYLEEKLGIQIPRDEPENLAYYLGYWMYWAKHARPRDPDRLEGWNQAVADAYEEAEYERLRQASYNDIPESETAHAD